MPTRSNELIRVLAEIDGLLAEAEEIAASPEDECRQSTLDFLIEFHDAKLRVDSELRGE